MKRNRGITTTEYALLFPILFGFFLGLVQVIIYMQSRTAVQYAAFAAARAFQVYGDRTLKEIKYPRVRELPYTNQDQTIAEAAAEKIIFESLLWERKKITVSGGPQSLDRYYSDGIQHQHDGLGGSISEGVVQVNFTGGSGVEVIYCLPIVFPGISALFESVKKTYPCKGAHAAHHYDGIAISYTAKLGREPAEI